jgi:hypothetical protein
MRIRNIYAFGQRSLILTETNDLYVSGMDFSMSPIEKFKFLEHLPTVPRHISLGLEHCLLLDCNIS